MPDVSYLPEPVVTPLDVYYFSGGNRANEPVTVDDDIALDDVMTDILANPQPHPTVVYARDRPTIGPEELPDHQLKFDLDTEHNIAAVHLFCPRGFLPAGMTGEADDTTAWIALPRQPATPLLTGVTLYIDRDTRTEFPREAALPLSVLRSLLHEFMRTGKRPTCVDWQRTDIF
ncbi:Imm1 family immunity protein [Actinosynnema sp. NPDC023587]|uniref:Imm1 family immunity protein n=1 Tax=Actinosynnema sp. NPDC023587 TaxID=3154695 RepID=UPI0033D669C8